MPDILEVFFGSKARTRILRFFLLNPEKEYDSNEVSRRNMLKPPEVLKEMNALSNIRFVHEHRRKGKRVYVLNTHFSFYPELRNLMIKSNVYPQCQSLGKIKNIGDVKLALVSGAFLDYPKSKADMIVVADNVSRVRLKNLMNNLEAEIGKEVSFVLMNSEELKYRMNMMDRFLMEFLEGPHDEIINKVPGMKRFIAGLKK